MVLPPLEMEIETDLDLNAVNPSAVPLAVS
jgi:hypothetical protein